jgi:hypothetical protein
MQAGPRSFTLFTGATGAAGPKGEGLSPPRTQEAASPSARGLFLLARCSLRSHRPPGPEAGNLGARPARRPRLPLFLCVLVALEKGWGRVGGASHARVSAVQRRSGGSPRLALILSHGPIAVTSVVSTVDSRVDRRSRFAEARRQRNSRNCQSLECRPSVIPPTRPEAPKPDSK